MPAVSAVHISATHDVSAHRGTRIKRLARRWLAPLLSDEIFGALLRGTRLFILRSDVSLGLVQDANTGYHIRTGDFIIQHRAVPHGDIFSFSKPQQPWFAWEWLSAVLFASLHSALGLKGLV